MPATLYIAATPLGNLDDITKRLADVLRVCDVVYAEDTRRSRILVNHLGLKKELRSLHGHNEMHRTGEVMRHLEEGHDIVVLTDAGTPAVSDPGAEVVAAAHAAGYKVAPIAGPSALAAAISVAGFTGPGVHVLFTGFLPTSGKDQREAWEKVLAHRGVSVIFEAPNRLSKALQRIVDSEPSRPVCMCREMTKMYEEIRRGTAEELLAWAQAQEILGEITLVVGPTTLEEVSTDDAAIEAAVDKCLTAGLSARDTASAVAVLLDVSRKQVYSLCLKRSDKR